MGIPESQLETWSHQGLITNSANTGNSIKYALETYRGFPYGVKFDVYMQDSYKNDTNVYGESDVDVVVELTSSLQNNLTPGRYFDFNEAKEDGPAFEEKMRKFTALLKEQMQRAQTNDETRKTNLKKIRYVL